MRGRAAAAGPVAVLLLVACGVPQDGSARALEPWEVPFASPTDSPVAESVGDRQVDLGFVRDDSVLLSSRTVEDPRTTEEVLELLFAGPSPDERAAGLSTLLPSTVTVQDVELVDGTAVVATLTPNRVSGVRFRLDDTDLRVPREDGSQTDQPLSRRDYAGLLAPSATVAPTPSA